MPEPITPSWIRHISSCPRPTAWPSPSTPIRVPAVGTAYQFVRESGWTRLFVDALVVDRALWRHGIGTELLAAAESWGRARGADVVRLDTYAEGPVAVPFYERHGYRRRSILFQKPLLPGGAQGA